MGNIIFPITVGGSRFGVLEASKVSGLKRKKDSDAEPVNLAGDSWIFVSCTPREN